MRWMLIILLCTLPLGAAAKGSCLNDQFCPHRHIVLAQADSFPHSLRAMIQLQYGGRIIGISRVSKKPCKSSSRPVTIGGRKQELKGTACEGEDGDWQMGNLYRVQVMSHGGRIIVLTVNVDTGKIIEEQR